MRLIKCNDSVGERDLLPFFYIKIYHFSLLIINLLLSLYCQNKQIKKWIKKEIKQQLLFKRMETKVKIDTLRASGAKRFERQIDALLNRMNDIDRILAEIDKKE